GEMLQGPAISIFRVMMELHIDIGILLFSLEDGNINGSGIRFIKSVISEYYSLFSKYNNKLPELFNDEYFHIIDRYYREEQLSKQHWSNINGGEQFNNRVEWFFNKQKDEKGSDIYYSHYRFFSKMGTHVTPLMIGAHNAFDEDMIPEFSAIIQLGNVEYMHDIYHLDKTQVNQYKMELQSTIPNNSKE
ncbi:MAG TPA: hypothetical protein VMF29_04030, partial [Candidatus Edwardsbacteria bacterium]|nr:hypothetical protein [Candidatus Edwardsbacteria bacterium]